MDVLCLEQAHIEEKWQKILQDPLDPLLLAELLMNHKVKLSKITKRYMQKLFRKATVRSLRRGATLLPVDPKKATSVRRSRLYRESKITGEKVYSILKSRFEANKRQGACKGEWKLTQEQVDWLFFKYTTRGIQLSKHFGSIRLKRIKQKRDIELKNLMVVLVKKRGSKKKMKTKRKVLFDYRKHKKLIPEEILNSYSESGKA